MAGLFNSNELLNDYKSSANASYPTTISQNMKLKLNLSDADTEIIYNELNQIFKMQQDPATQQAIIHDTPELDLKFTKLFDKLELKVNKTATTSANKQQTAQNKSEQRQTSRVEQNADTAKQIEEPEAQDSNFAEPVNMEPATNSLAEDYPNTIGTILENGDFIKINKLKGTIDVVHHSGTMIRIDDLGNINITSNGNIKQMISGDLTIEANGGIDIVSGKGVYIHAPELELVSDNKTKIEASEVSFDSVSQIKASDATMCEFGGNATFNGAVKASGFSN